MIGFKPVGESAPINRFVLAVDDLGLVIVEYNYSVEHVASDFLSTNTNSALDFLVQVNFLDQVHIHICFLYSLNIF